MFKKNKSLLIFSGAAIGFILGNIISFSMMHELKRYKQELENSEDYIKKLEKLLLETKWTLADISDKLWLAKHNYHVHFDNSEFIESTSDDKID